jgi:hypothetical protein
VCKWVEMGRGGGAGGGGVAPPFWGVDSVAWMGRAKREMSRALTSTGQGPDAQRRKLN